MKVQDKIFDLEMRIAFNKENVTELFSQIIKILEREGRTPKSKKLIQDVRSLSSDIQKDLAKSRELASRAEPEKPEMAIAASKK